MSDLSEYKGDCHSGGNTCEAATGPWKVNIRFFDRFPLTTGARVPPFDNVVLTDEACARFRALNADRWPGNNDPLTVHPERLGDRVAAEASDPVIGDFSAGRSTPQRRKGEQ